MVPAQDRDPVALDDPGVGQRAGERVGAAVHLAPGQRPELVHERRAVAAADVVQGGPGGECRAPALQRPPDAQQPVRALWLEDAGLQERARGEELRRQLTQNVHMKK